MFTLDSKKISLAVLLAILVTLLAGNSALAASVRVAGTVASIIDQKAIEKAGVTITNADQGPSQFFPKSTLTGGEGGYNFEIPETEFGGNNTLRVFLTVEAPIPQTATTTANFTVQKTGTNNVPIITLDVAGNTSYTPPLGGATGQSSGTIKYTSPDLSPIFKDKQYETLGDYLTDLVKVAMVLSVVAATLVVVYAGFGYLNSGGSPEATAKSKEMIAGALFGIATVFLMSAFLVSLYSPEALAPPTQRNGATGTGPQAPADTNTQNQTTTTNNSPSRGAVLAREKRERIEGLIKNGITDCERIYNIIEAEERNRGETLSPSIKLGFLTECENIRKALK